MSEPSSRGGWASAEALEFEQRVLSQLSEIFPQSSPLGTSTSEVDMLLGRSDFVSRTRDGRPLLFEVKFLRSGSRLPYAMYLQMAAYKDHLTAEGRGVAPIVALVVNVPVTAQTATTFAKSGIPVITLGPTTAETRADLKRAFDRLAIEIPELDSSPGLTRREVRRCFVALPSSVESRAVLQDVVAPVLREAGYVADRSDPASTDPWVEGTVDAIRTGDIMIADLTGASPNVIYAVGVAHSAGKPTILLSRDEKLPYGLEHSRVLRYAYTAAGISQLRGNLREALRALEYRFGIR